MCKCLISSLYGSCLAIGVCVCACAYALSHYLGHLQQVADFVALGFFISQLMFVLMETIQKYQRRQLTFDV